MQRPTQLYLISPPKIELTSFRQALEAALAAGESADERAISPQSGASCENRQIFTEANKKFIGAFQLRLKETNDETMRKAVRELMPICREHEVAFIINDRPDLCAEFQCDGVHIGQEDLEKTGIKEIRHIVGDDAVIGVTCHASKHLAMEAGEQGADVVAFGAFYPTTSKPREKLEKWGAPTPEILTWWQAYMTLPCVAIGGITPGNCKELAKAGADFLAVITAVWNHPEGPAAAVKEFERAIV